jgi:tRNA-specific 2-thiouridylase
VFIKVWSFDWAQDKQLSRCTAKEDRLDAMRVCAKLDIPFYTLDLEKEYKKEVVDYMISEYKAGRTPNPDVMCNKHVKFGGFLSWALGEGADFVATGHYAQNIYDKEKGVYRLVAGADENKDQSYFLWTIPQEKLPHILFPVGGMPKENVRKIAAEAGLFTAAKKDSQGLCFIGKLDIKDFLKEYIDEKRGDVLNEEGEIIGYHEGSFFYTLGERHGFVITKKGSEDTPYYVIKKDLEKNTLIVSKNPYEYYSSELSLKLIDTNWISELPEKGKEYEARIRYRGDLASVKIDVTSEREATLFFERGDHSAASGQSVVVYDGEIMVGGGIIQ